MPKDDRKPPEKYTQFWRKPIQVLFGRCSELEEINRKLHKVINMMENTMANLADLTAKVDRISAGVTAIRQDIVDIKNSIPAAGGLTEAEVAELSSKLDKVVADVDALDAENPSQP